MNLFELFFKIGVEDEASEKVDNLSDKFKKNLTNAAKVGAAAITAVTTATIALGTALAKAISQTANYGDEIDKQSQKMGLTTRAYQEWDFVLQHCGTSISALQQTMKTLSNAAQTNSTAFAELGIDMSRIAEMSEQELFETVIEQLQGIEDGTRRTYLASQLLGRGSIELGALLNMTAEETREMRNRLSELNGVMSDESIKASAQYKDSLQDLGVAFNGLKYSLSAEFLPSISQAMNGLTEIFSGRTDSGIEKLTEGVLGFVDSLSEQAPKFIDAFSKIVTAIAKGLVRNLPSIIRGILPILEDILTEIINILPELVESLGEIASSLTTTAIKIVVLLGEGLGKALPTLIPSIVKIVLAIAEELINNIDLVIDAAIQIALGLINGLVDSIPLIVAEIPRIVDALAEKLTDQETLGKIAEAGLTIGWELIKGIFQVMTELNPTKIGQAIGEGLVGGIFGDGSNGHSGGRWESTTDYSSEFGTAEGYGRGTMVVQNIYSTAKTAAEEQEEAAYMFSREKLLGV